MPGDLARSGWGLKEKMFVRLCRCMTCILGIYKNRFYNQRTSGPVNTHLISWPSKAQNIQNLESFHKKFSSDQQSSS